MPHCKKWGALQHLFKVLERRLLYNTLRSGP